MTKRQTLESEFQWKITMTHTGAFSYGYGYPSLASYAIDCYRRGACFKVEMKKLHTKPTIGHVRIDEDERCIGWIEGSSTELADAAVGLADRVLDEQSAKREPRSDRDRGD